MLQIFQILMFLDGFLMWNIIGQGALAMVIGEHRFNNPIYKIIAGISSPVFILIGAILPGRHGPFTIGMVSLFFLFLMRIVIYMIFYKMGWIPADLSQPPA